MLTERGFYTPRLSHLRADDALLSAFDVDHLAPEALLWQTGYLTFTGTRQIGVRREYRLGYPNLEVSAALNDSQAKALIGQPGQASELASRLWLFEFKVVELPPEGAAPQQIKDRGDADKYRAEGLPMHLIGIEFSRKERTLVGFEVDTLMP